MAPQRFQKSVSMANGFQKPTSRKTEAKVEDKPPKNQQRNMKIERIDNKQKRHISFWKRRAGLFKKALDLSTLCDIDIAVVAFSPGGSPYTFGSPSVEAVLARYHPFQESLTADGEGDLAPSTPCKHPGDNLWDAETSIESTTWSEAEMQYEENEGMKSRNKLEAMLEIKVEEEFPLNEVREPGQCSLATSTILAASPLIQAYEVMTTYDAVPLVATFMGTREEQELLERATHTDNYSQYLDLPDLYCNIHPTAATAADLDTIWV